MSSKLETQMTPPLLKEKKDGVFTLTLNRPEALNALTVPMMESLDSSLKEAARENEIRVVVITGAGRAFCVGQDLKEHLERRPRFLEDLRQRYNPLVLKIRRLEKPVIAAVNGVAAGAGMSLALACDFRIMAKTAAFHTAFIKIGLAPDSGNLYFLLRHLGPTRALELALTGRALPAEEAERWGLINRAVEPENFPQEVERWARSLAEAPAVAVALSKRMLNSALFAKDFAAQLEDEAYCQELAGRTQDHAEGLRAFLEKRTPKFKGS